MTHKKALYGSTAVLFAMAHMAHADVTANDVWNNMSGFYSAAGYEIEPGSVSDSGGKVTVTDLKINFPNPYADLQEEIAIDMFVNLPSIMMTENGDGTVNVVTSDVYEMIVSITPEGEEQGVFVLSVDQTGTDMVASGDPGMVTYDISSPMIKMMLDRIEIPGEDDLNDAFDASITLNNMSATYTMGTGDIPTLDMTLAAAGADFVMTGQEPGGPGAANADFSFKEIGWDTKTSFAQGNKPGDLTSMLRAGMSSDSTLTHGGSTYSFDFTDRGDSFAMSGSADSGSAKMAMGDAVMSYLVSNTGMNMTVSGSEIPLPEVALSAAASAFGMTLPVIATDEHKDMGVTLRLEGFSVSDMIWGMLDPGAQLPRDPANLIVELAGKANWLLDVMDPMAMAEFRGGLPGGIHALDINELELSVAGASVTGAGAFTIDMTNFETFDGVPAPTGALDLQIVGANGLMDKLVAMGLLPEDQAMGARMMMGLFARPGDGEDTLTSKIEVDGATGSVSANGQRLQ